MANDDFTAIYLSSWVQGPHGSYSVKMARIRRLEGESIADMLSREGIAETVVYLFDGHPALHCSL